MAKIIEVYLLITDEIKQQQEENGLNFENARKVAFRKFEQQLKEINCGRSPNNKPITTGRRCPYDLFAKTLFEETYERYKIGD